MKVNHKLKIDLARSGITPRLEATQSDALSRVLALQLTEDGSPWPIPKGAKVLIRFRKEDRTGGIYDTLPDGTCAWCARGNTLYITLAPQVLTAPGETELTVTLVQGTAQLTTLTAVFDVKPLPNFTGTSEGYSCITAFVPQPEYGARAGQFLRISQVDSQGNILAMEAVSGAGGGIGSDSSQLLLQLLKNAVYTADVSGILAELEESFSQEAVILSGITAIYTGGAVVAGTAVSALSGITVTAQYSDGSTANVTDYALSGTIGAGENTVTVSYGGFTDTFTVIGTEAQTDPDSYSVQNNLTNAVNSNAATSVEAGGAYTCTITAANGYVLSSIVITMGGTTVVNKTFTDAPLESGWSTQTVTGDIVITAVAQKAAATLTGISVAYSGGEVEEGTALSDLTGITVTAHYSDGSTATVTDYTLSGEIAEGSNTITVSYGGMTATFTVTGIVEDDGPPLDIAILTEEFVVGAISNSSPYINSTSISRLSYVGTAVAVSAGKTYVVTPTYSVEAHDLKYGVQYADKELVDTSATVSSTTKIDSGWQTAESYTVTPTFDAYIWLCFANSSGSYAVDASKIVSVNVKEV